MYIIFIKTDSLNNSNKTYITSWLNHNQLSQHLIIAGSMECNVELGCALRWYSFLLLAGKESHSLLVAGSPVFISAVSNCNFHMLLKSLFHIILEYFCYYCLRNILWLLQSHYFLTYYTGHTSSSWAHFYRSISTGVMISEACLTSYFDPHWMHNTKFNIQ